jgi:SAP domain
VLCLHTSCCGFCACAQPLTVPELKEQLRSHGLRVIGKREELVQRLLEHTQVSHTSSAMLYFKFKFARGCLVFPLCHYNLLFMFM